MPEHHSPSAEAKFLIIETTPDGISLSGKVYIHEIQFLVDALQKQMESDLKTVQVNMTGVESIDTAALQTLVSARKSAHKVQKGFVLFPINETVREALTLTGLDNVFDLEFS